MKKFNVCITDSISRPDSHLCARGDNLKSRGKTQEETKQKGQGKLGSIADGLC
jgi:hypothetical protein